MKRIRPLLKLFRISKALAINFYNLKEANKVRGRFKSAISKIYTLLYYR